MKIVFCQCVVSFTKYIIHIAVCPYFFPPYFFSVSSPLPTDLCGSLSYRVQHCRVVILVVKLCYGTVFKEGIKENSTEDFSMGIMTLTRRCWNCWERLIMVLLINTRNLWRGSKREVSIFTKIEHDVTYFLEKDLHWTHRAEVMMVLLMHVHR